MVKLVYKDNALGIPQFEGCWDCEFNKGTSRENMECLTCARHYRPEAREEVFPDRFTKKSVPEPLNRTETCKWV